MQEMETRAQWWIWAFYGSPTSYSLWGLVASQLGDVEDEFVIDTLGNRVSVADYIGQYFGFNHDFLGWAVLLLVAFIALFRLTAIWALSNISFQKR